MDSIADFSKESGVIWVDDCRVGVEREGRRRRREEGARYPWMYSGLAPK